MPRAIRKEKKTAKKKKSVSSARGLKRRVSKKPRAAAKKILKKTARARDRYAPILRSLRAAALRERRARDEKHPHRLERHEDNPIIEPRENLFWEMKATFNPAAIYADHRVHLLYRAIGGGDVSVLGYASSEDGLRFTDRLEEPAFVPRTKMASPADEAVGAVKPAEYPGPAYCSGGGWNGGSEDPRLTVIDRVVYLMYTAFDGWGSIRIALSSIDLKDFLAKRWKWKDSVLISPPGEIHKNWVLFPEKIRGKFAILHSISPSILIDYFDTLDDFDQEENVIESRYDRVSRTGSWDSWIRGAGPPPIRTKLGWLLFYHAMDLRDPNRYKLGAMILDADNPTKVLYRSRAPILEPDAYYENQGFKSGVIYSCGAVVKDGELYVYYGGGDTVTCVAMANLDRFLEELKKQGTPRLTPEFNAKAKPKDALR